MISLSFQKIGGLYAEITSFWLLFAAISSLSFFSLFNLYKNDFSIKILSSAEELFSFKIFIVLFLLLARHWSVNSDIL